MLLLLSGCTTGNNAPVQQTDPAQMTWEEVENTARNTTVRMMMWQGDPLINRYMSEWVAGEVKKRYNIELVIAPGQGNEIVRLLLGEKEAGKTTSSIDMCWINGETFYQLRQIDALYGPFAQKLPNSRFIDFSNPFIARDFQQETAGFECPWGNVQLAIIYDSVRTPEPPRTLEALEAYVTRHPGVFTIPYEFTGMTLLKSWMAGLAGDKNALNGPFDEGKYQRYSTELFDRINRMKGNFWRNGRAFPERLAEMHQMFANGELHFTMSNNDREVDNKIAQGILPGSAKSYVWATGTIQNSHFLGIPKGAGNKAGAMAVINFLISPEAQARKLDPRIWGDGTVLNPEKVRSEGGPDLSRPGDWSSHAPKRADMQPLAIEEPAPEYMIRLYEDFRKYVIEKQ